MEVINNKREYRFESALADGGLAFLSYRWLKGRMVMLHTFVPETSRGAGLADGLVGYALEHARSQGLKVVVYCPFVAKYIERYPEYADLAG